MGDLKTCMRGLPLLALALGAACLLHSTTASETSTLDEAGLYSYGGFPSIYARLRGRASSTAKKGRTASRPILVRKRKGSGSGIAPSRKGLFGGMHPAGSARLSPGGRRHERRMKKAKREDVVKTRKELKGKKQRAKKWAKTRNIRRKRHQLALAAFEKKTKSLKKKNEMAIKKKSSKAKEVRDEKVMKKEVKASVEKDKKKKKMMREHVKEVNKKGLQKLADREKEKTKKVAAYD